MPKEMLLWPDGPTYTFKPGGPETWTDDDVMPREGVVNRVVRYVSEPTLTLFPAAEEQATGAAMIVAPGGGMMLLAMDKEGYDVARWLNTLGVTVLVLKYRVRPDPHKGMATQLEPGVWGAILSDGQRAVRTVRARAAEWGLDPARIGMMGFSAGSRLTAQVTLHSDDGDPKAADPVERVSCRPDFIGLMYGARRMARRGATAAAGLYHGGQRRSSLCRPRRHLAAFVRGWTAQGVPVECITMPGAAMALAWAYGGAAAGWPGAMAAWLRDLGVLGV